jgi:hypothetical protein
MSWKIFVMIDVGYPLVSSALAGRVSPTTAKSSRETLPPVDPTLPVGGAPPSSPPPLLPPLLPLPPPLLLPPLQVLGGDWHLSVSVLQYQPP